jgi:hypothetical protein
LTTLLSLEDECWVDIHSYPHRHAGLTQWRNVKEGFVGQAFKEPHSNAGKTIVYYNDCSQRKDYILPHCNAGLTEWVKLEVIYRSEFKEPHSDAGKTIKQMMYGTIVEFQAPHKDVGLTITYNKRKSTHSFAHPNTNAGLTRYFDHGVLVLEEYKDPHPKKDQTFVFHKEKHITTVFNYGHPRYGDIVRYDDVGNEVVSKDGPDTTRKRDLSHEAKEAIENMRGKVIARNVRQRNPDPTDKSDPDKKDEGEDDTREAQSDCMFVKEMTREERDQVGWKNAIIIE